MRFLLAIMIGTVVSSAGAQAASRPVVMELFTSEGCSSCPPADALLTSLAGRRDLLPLAFHVTYWNSLGWRDPYSFEGATSRQASYATRLGGGSYTPEMVIDGRRGVVGSEHGAVAGAIAAARGEAVAAAPVRLQRGGRGLTISVGQGQGSGRILLIGFDPQHETHVGRGENSGRTLLESNIVLSIRSIGEYHGTPVELSEPTGAGQEAAVIIEGNGGSILGAGRL